ncbi:MAG TPA: RNA polymerase sigma factor [Bryobacteraceae bacterium]|nr:RNA polymerase sigma factor [Bryobacteraceae bacterium]
MPADLHITIEALWRIESPRLIAALARIVRDIGAAEDLAQDALVAALEQWPEQGIPDNPGAWLMTVAHRRALDRFRLDKLHTAKHEHLTRDEIRRQMTAPGHDANLDDPIGDDLLRLIFTACHPVLSAEARAALTLRLLGGLTTAEIARAFLTSEPTIAQRIVRAKRNLAEAGVPFEVPRGEELRVRLASVLEVIYLIFNEGYSATSGDDWTRPALCEEALRLGRILAELTPAEQEVHGLVALMEIQASRLRARTGPRGEPILLADQNRALWDQLLIHRGLAAMKRADKLGNPPGAYELQAWIAACHAVARTAEETDWARIAGFYRMLGEITPSPIVELNRAVAVSKAFGAQPALEIMDRLRDEPTLRSYHLSPAVRADLLISLGRFEEAREELARAASLARNTRERDLLLERARVL